MSDEKALVPVEQKGDEMKVKWRPRAFQMTMISAGLFVALTLLAMLVYPGGTYTDPAAARYQFFNNFFSDLGRTRAFDGEPNTVSLLLFSSALAMSGLGLVAFFLAMPFLFRRRRLHYGLAIAGSVFGVIAGLSYIGVALTPADQYGEAHSNFVFSAFGFFFVAVLFYIPAMFLDREYPRFYPAVFVAFALLLAAYLWLLFFGPRSEGALTLQVTGQKIIAYAAIVAIMFQGYGGWKVGTRGN
ncbi:MAG: hypothetical protein L0332_36060 [Chloroflexi bacterium]|nr:hypothetical protein [Chloroflexota bacterium]MCI0578297.1 hypothetical protein [Chloroflexota bacterium]MCI0648754.1 hypothetical protein [Chloroflexota bacterium]MCI0732113.1 hypothetical protein [Chloroflexota bacterium]